MPERDGKNRVCGCKVLMHGWRCTTPIHTQGQLQVFSSRHRRALYHTRTDGG